MKSKVILEIKDNIAEIILNRPEIGNAFDQEVISKITQHLQTLAQDPHCRVLILRSIGKHFSTGADLNWMRSMTHFSYEENIKDAKALAKMLRLLSDFPKPTLVCIQGAAFGGAVGLTACCDIALAAFDAKFCLSEVKLGLIPAVISPYVISAIGQRQAKCLMLTAEVFDAHRAMQLNLIHKLIEKEILIKEAHQVASALLKNAPQALTACKKLVKDIAQISLAEAQDEFTAKLISEIRVSQEGQEGLQAFLNKRTPNWSLN